MNPDRDARTVNRWVWLVAHRVLLVAVSCVLLTLVPGRAERSTPIPSTAMRGTRIAERGTAPTGPNETGSMRWPIHSYPENGPTTTTVH